jgi:hypothetical protein
VFADAGIPAASRNFCGLSLMCARAHIAGFPAFCCCFWYMWSML